MDFAQSIQQRHATLKKTGVLQASLSDNNLSSASSPHNKAPQPKPKPKPTKNKIYSEAHNKQLHATPVPLANLHAERKMPSPETTSTFPSKLTPGTPYSTTQRAPKRMANPPSPKQVNIPRTEFEVATNSDDECEEAYDDIQQFQIQKQPKRDVDTPPPLPPPNPGLIKSTSSDRIPAQHSANKAEQKFSPYGSQMFPTAHKKDSTTHPLHDHTSTQHMLRRKPVLESQSGHPDASDSSMGLEDFVRKHHTEFPVQIKVCSIHEGVKVNLNKGDVYNVHFLKNTDVVSMVAGGGTRYVVPLNSAIEFGIVYDPTSNVQDAIQGFVFSNAGEIMSTGFLPPIICAQKSYEVSSQDGSVQEGDVLAVHEVKQKLLRNKCLSCTDVRTDQRKKLIESCSGDFSTTPDNVKIFLPQILRYFPLPQSCSLFYRGKNAHEVVSKLPSGVIELTGTKVQKSVIISKKNSSDLMELFLNNSIIVQAVQPKGSEEHKLITETRKHFEAFNAAQISGIPVLFYSENPYTLNKQITLLSSIRQNENALIGVKAVPPPKLSPTAFSSVTQNINTNMLKKNSIYGLHSSMAPASEKIKQGVVITSSVDDDDDDDSDYQIPVVALEEYKIANKEALQLADNTHYDTPKSSIPRATIDDDEVYDIPSPVITSKKKDEPCSPSSLPSKNLKEKTLQKEIEFLKAETRSLRTAVEKLENICSTLSKNLGKLKFI